MDDRGEKFLAGIMQKGSLPTLSPLAVRLISLAAEEDVQPRDMARIIEADPSLTARLLSLVNSVAYRRSENMVSSITRAVMLLGVRELRIMALSLSLRDTLPAKKSEELDYALFWRLNVQRAIMAQRIAQILLLPNPEEAFPAALVLEIGMPLMLRDMTPELRQGYPGLDVSHSQRLAWEDAKVGVTHRQIGAEVVKHWNLPSFFADCMLYPLVSGNEMMAKVVDFASFAAESCLLPHCSFTQVHLQGRKELGLNSEQVNQVIADTLEMAGQVAQSLQVELDQEQDMLAVMEKANEALSRLSSEVTPQLRQVVQKAVQLGSQRLQQKAVSNTLEAVMHEIRNPLMSVGGFARRLAGHGEAGGNTQRYAKVIIDEAGRLNKVLDRVSILLAPLKPAPLKVDFFALMRQVRAQLPAADIAWHLPPGTLWLLLDGKLFEEALLLLLEYAAQSQNHLIINLLYSNKQIKVQISGQGYLPGSQKVAMDELAFGPELNLMRIRRIMDSLEGDLNTIFDEEGFILVLTLPENN